MHILLVNDDGISAVGIKALLEAAVQRGHTVTMSAPATQQSAASHRITLTEPIFMQPYETGLPGVEAFAIKGTPADCVRIAIRGGLMCQRPDVIISGINNGHNAGTDVHYSGTVGAAMEGSMVGYRSIATSIGWNAAPDALRALAELTMDMAERYSRIPPLPMSVMNINAPSLPPESWMPTVYAPLNVSCSQDAYERRESPFNGSYYWLTGCAEPMACMEGTDQWYLSRGHVTVTMLGNFGSLSTQEWNGLGI